jgi:hypothetical protein
MQIWSPNNSNIVTLNQLLRRPYRWVPLRRKITAEKAFDADKRVIEPLLAAGKTLVIPPKSNRKIKLAVDKEIYKARHLMENFYCKLSFAPSRRVMTRPPETSSPPSTWSPPSFGSINDRL